MATDWFCTDIKRPTGIISEFCLTNAEGCEVMRKHALTGKHGKPTLCNTQPIAHCVRTTSAITMSRQTLCTRSAKSCEVRRQYLLDNPRDPDEVLSPCAPQRNTDPFDRHPPVGELEL